ncbi:MAG: VanZ family protein [Anaerolineales bacterium]|nr:VanZ family protein [Anaerolineales bacterium]
MKWLTILFALFIVLIVYLADADKLGALGFINQIPYGDKAGHFLLFGILTLLLDLTLFRSLPLRDPRLVALSVGLTLVLVISVEEYSQQFFASRTFSLLDLAFSYLGVIFFSWVALKRSRAR